ncbi:hypothetical protein PBI_DEWDROP_42 [Microbacterium phage Dewdrop]|nr:hypothetical protein PBI_LEAF_42 [Microbacterium phage Leaf]QGZ17411.1 hypothetical protein PBI_DEWDROP_42 [Microbacterium phage Dewdrop]
MSLARDESDRCLFSWHRGDSLDEMKMRCEQSASDHGVRHTCGNSWVSIGAEVSMRTGRWAPPVTPPSGASALNRAPNPMKPPVKHEVLPERTTIRVSQRMPNGTVRDMEINPQAILGAIDLYHVDLTGSSTEITMKMKLRAVPGVPNEEAWMLRFTDHDEDPSEVPATDHLLWGQPAASASTTPTDTTTTRAEEAP